MPKRSSKTQYYFSPHQEEVLIYRGKRAEQFKPGHVNFNELTEVYHWVRVLREAIRNGDITTYGEPVKPPERIMCASEPEAKTLFAGSDEIPDVKFCNCTVPHWKQ